MIALLSCLCGRCERAWVATTTARGGCPFCGSLIFSLRSAA